MAPLAAAGLLTVGCGTNLGQGDGNAVAVIDSLQGASGAEPDDFGGVLFSDVVTVVDQDGTPVATVYADTGRVTMSLAARNPTLPTPTDLNDVTFSRYRVVYRPTDGATAVPAPFESAVTFTVPASGSGQFSFLLVRTEAKQTAPLVSLVGGGSIPAIADVTFYGRDQQGRNIEVTGSIGIEFANWADPE